MDKYTKDIMNVLKEKFEEVTGTHNYKTGSEARGYYLEKLEDNLYMPMSVGAKASYENGSGNELNDKMKALRSSSALTYNLFWDQIAEIKDGNEHFGGGVYQAEFEKQFHTLKPSVSRNPANLDAFLYCKHTNEAIACEMKMTEWIFNKPGMLKNAYLVPENYINEEAGKAFVEVAKDLILDNDYDDPDTAKAEYPCRMMRYDAFQMFKHAIACYTACVSEESRKIKKITLVNCAWTLSCPEKLEEAHRERYIQEEDCEKREFEEFKIAMLPIKKMFLDIDVEFDICFYSFNEFLGLFNKIPDELNYLRRYTMD